MNIQEIDKWLDNEYGCSYTRLEELHDFVVEQDLKHREEIERLNNIINELKKKITKAIKLLNKYRNRKDTYCLWCMDYGDNAEVIKILGGKVRKD